MADSGTYTPEVIARRMKLAEQLLGPTQKPITHWAEGLNELAKGYFGGRILDKAERDQKEGQTAANAELVRLLMPGAAPAAAPATPSPAPNAPTAPTADAPTGGPAAAIAGIESGGKYDALGPLTKGDRAYGKYQVMGNNIPAWTQQHLGQQMTPQQFLASPDAQEAVFKGEFGRLQQKYGPEGAARAWFAGERGMHNPNARDILGTSVADYARKFNAGLGRGAGTPQLAGGGARLEPEDIQRMTGGLPAPSPAPSGMAPLTADIPGPQAGMMPVAGPAAVAGALNAPAAPQVPPAAVPAMGGAPSGVDPMRARIAEMLQSKNPYVQQMGQGLAKNIVQKQLEGEKPTDDIRDYEYAKRQGFKGSLLDFTAAKRGGAGEYGLTPIWGTGPDGKPAFIQPGKAGKAIQGDVPAGFNIARDPIKIDGGTDWILLDPQTRQPIGKVSKNIAGTKVEGELGESTGKALVGLPGTIASADQAIKNIEQIRSHPGRKSLFGVGGLGWVPGIPGSDQAGFVALVDQLKGKTFLQAFESLKGGGAITEIEGKKAEQAIARLQRTQNDKDFDDALKDLEDVVKSGVDRAKTKAAGPGAPPAAAAPARGGGADPLGIR